MSVNSSSFGFWVAQLFSNQLFEKTGKYVIKIWCLRTTTLSYFSIRTLYDVCRGVIYFVIL